MLRICLTDRDLAAVRVAYSPFWEILAAAMAAPSFTPTAIRPRGRPDLLGAAAELGGLPSMAFLRHGFLPGFVSPLPSRQGEQLDATLERMLRIPDDDLDCELALAVERHPAGTAFARAWANPRAELERVAEAFRIVWRRALQPMWPSIAAVHEGHLVRMGLLLASDGPAAILDDFGPASFHDGALWYPDRDGADIRLEGRGLALISSVFAPHRHLVSLAGARPAVVLHPPAGRALLWTGRAQRRTDPAGELIGEPRAEILRLLAVPRATADVSGLLSMAPNTTSYHLARLKDAGFVRSVRVGRRVYYGLTSRGSAFLELWPADAARTSPYRPVSQSA